MSSTTKPRKQPTAMSRMKQDYMRLKRDPLPYITAEPLPNNILEWHYVVKGPANTPYYGGYYHGTLVFPREFPFKPPSIYMVTPNGRFKTNTRLCLSISGNLIDKSTLNIFYIIYNYRFSSRYLESNLVCWHHTHWTIEFHGIIHIIIIKNSLYIKFKNNFSWRQHQRLVP